MCFGVKSAPYNFDKLGKALKLHFAGLGIRIFVYLDDILVMANSAEFCRQCAQRVVDTLIALGFYIHVDKCVLIPSQSFFFLGFLWDTRRMICSLPLEKLERIKDKCQNASDSKGMSLWSLYVLQGLMASAVPAVPLARAKYRGIQEIILKHTKGILMSQKKMKGKYVILSRWAEEDIRWWLNLDIRNCNLSLKAVPVWQSIRLASDAMETAVGSILAGEIMYKELEPHWIQHSIAHKEWLAFEWTIQPALHRMKNKVVTWHVDNTNAKQAWLNIGTCVDQWLCKRVVQMQTILHAQNTKVVPVYVRSAQHLHADLISRKKVLPDWHLRKELAQKVFQVFGLPEVDLMATAASAQVSTYISATQDSKALAVDAFTEDWNQFSLVYIFPPPQIIELVLKRIFHCKKSTTFIVISPWKALPWIQRAFPSDCQITRRRSRTW